MKLVFLNSCRKYCGMTHEECKGIKSNNICPKSAGFIKIIRDYLTDSVGGARLTVTYCSTASFFMLVPYFWDWHGLFPCQILLQNTEYLMELEAHSAGES